jgi:hypothetical protein
MWGLAIVLVLWVICTVGVLLMFDSGKKQDRRFRQALKEDYGDKTLQS